MKMLSMKSQMGPQLASGVFYQTFGEFEKVTHAIVGDTYVGASSQFFNVSGYALVRAYPMIVSGNVVQVNVEKTSLSGDIRPVPATSGDAISNTFTVLAYGE